MGDAGTSRIVLDGGNMLEGGKGSVLTRDGGYNNRYS